MYSNQAQPNQNHERSFDLYEQDEILSWRFKFNSNERVWKTEEMFYLSFMEMERAFKSSLFIISDYLTQTDLAIYSFDPTVQNSTFESRLQLLTELKRGMKDISKIFHHYVKESKIEPNLWAEYVQSIFGWNINGIESGASGAESILFHALDEFLNIPGECVLYRSAVDKRSGVPHYCRQLIDSLKHGREYRFLKLNATENNHNPLMKCRDDIIQCLGMWRLSHAKISKKYLVHSQMTASGTVDKIYDEEKENLAIRAEAELRERARETLKCISDGRRRRKSIDMCQAETKGLQHLSLLEVNVSRSYWHAAYEYVKNMFTSRE